MDEVGRLFEIGEVFVPEMLVSANAMKAGMELLQPLLELSDVKPLARIVLGTVQGDIHDIGKNLVGMMLKGAGFEVIDLGVNVPPARFVAAVADGAAIVGLSALLTTTMPNMKVTIAALTAAGLRDRDQGDRRRCAGYRRLCVRDRRRRLWRQCQSGRHGSQGVAGRRLGQST